MRILQKKKKLYIVLDKQRQKHNNLATIQSAQGSP